MAGPNFPIRVPADQKRLITKGNQKINDRKEGFTESHRKAFKTNARVDPNEMLLWSGGSLADEI